MDFGKVKDKWFVFVFSTYVAVAILGLIIFIIDENLLDLDYYYSLYLIPIVFVILHNVDIENSKTLDEYLFILISGSLFGIALPDYLALLDDISSIGLIPYFISIGYYLLLMVFINNIINNLVKEKKE